MSCMETEYRSFDGSCNNLHAPRAGAAGSCHQRILPSSYSDGVARPRHHKASPSSIMQVFSAGGRPRFNPVGEANALAMLFRQFIAHDITGTFITKLDDWD